MHRTHTKYTAVDAERIAAAAGPAAGSCPVAGIVAIIGGKWKPTILLRLKDRPRGFNELQRLIPGISQRALTLQLRALEADGVITRTRSEGKPLRVSYAFSPYGLTLGPVLDTMEAWWDAHRRSLRGS